jgi:hypothetical protein
MRDFNTGKCRRAGFAAHRHSFGPKRVCAFGQSRNFNRVASDRIGFLDGNLGHRAVCRFNFYCRIRVADRLVGGELGDE